MGRRDKSVVRRHCALLLLLLAVNVRSQSLEEFGDLDLSLQEAYIVLNDSRIYERIRDVQTRISQAMNFNDLIDVKILIDQEVNARATGGGRIYIFTGLLDFCNSIDELAGVLAHEIAHLKRRHLAERVKYLKNQIFWSEIATAFLGAFISAKTGRWIPEGSQGQWQGLMQQVAGLGMQNVSSIWIAEYSREQEFEADADAYTALKVAGFRAEAYRDLLFRMGGPTLTATDSISNNNKKPPQRQIPTLKTGHYLLNKEVTLADRLKNLK